MITIYLNRIVDIPPWDMGRVGLPVDVAEEHRVVAQGEAVEGEAVEDVLPGVAVHLVEGEAQVPHVPADDVQPIVVPGGSRSSDLGWIVLKLFICRKLCTFSTLETKPRGTSMMTGFSFCCGRKYSL